MIETPIDDLISGLAYAKGEVEAFNATVYVWIQDGMSHSAISRPKGMACIALRPGADSIPKILGAEDFE